MEGKTTNFEKRDIFRHKLTYHEKIESLKQVQPEIDERKWKKKSREILLHEFVLSYCLPRCLWINEILCQSFYTF